MLDFFPELVLENIFIYLDKRDLFHLMTLNKKILGSSERIFWASTCLRKRRDYEVLKDNLDHVYRFIKRLHIPTGSRFHNINQLLKFSRQLRGLSELDLRDMHLPKNYFHIITLRCPYLKIVNLSRTDVTDNCLSLIARNCRKIRKLELFDCNIITDHGIRQFENTGLTHLSVSSQKITCAICQSLPLNLVYLHSERLGKVRPCFLLNMPATLKEVKFTSTFVCSIGIQNILLVCKVIEHLQIVQGYEWNPLGFCRRKSLSKEQIDFYLENVPSLKCIQQE